MHWKGNLVIFFCWIFALPFLVDSDSASSTSSSPSSHSSSNAAAKDDGGTSSSWTESDSDHISNYPGRSHPEIPETLSNMGNVIPGIYKEYLPQPIFYESAVPAIFQYQTPQWNKTDITFNNWYTCLTESVPYRYSCPVTFHMNKAIVNLHVDFEGIHPISDVRSQSLQASMKHYYDRLTDHSDFCDKIQKHFAGIWTEASDFKRYWNAIQGCSRSSSLHPYFERSLPDYNYGFRQPFTKMENNFYNTFYKLILGSGGNASSSLDLVASALLSNTRTSLQGAILGQYYAEKNRWVHANEDCRQGYIPTSLVTSEKFNKSLTAILKMNSFRHENDLSISPSQMSKYYSLPLTDCTHTSDSLVVRVLIPILKKFREEILQLVHLHTIPFQYKDHICQVKFPQSKYSKVDGDGVSSQRMFLYHELTQRAYPTNCEPNQLCQISGNMLDIRKSDPCVSSLLSKNETGIGKFCGFECRPKEDYILPAVVRVSANKFVVAGNALSARVTCGRMAPTDKLIYVKADHVGAMLVKLPCFCRLIIPQFNVYFSGPSCENGDGQQDVGGGDDFVPHHNDVEPVNNVGNVEISSIIPFMFVKLKKGGRGSEEASEKTANSVNRQSEDEELANYGSLGDGQLLNLTGLLDRERIENYIMASDYQRELDESRSFKGMDYYAEHLRDGTLPTEGTSGGVGGLFWSIFIISLIAIFSLQAYIIVMFKRSERTSYSKDERILYRVEPDTASLG